MMKSSIPQIVVTGSSGFLGQHLLHSLIKEPLKLGTSTGNGEVHIHALYGGLEGFDQAVQETLTINRGSTAVKIHVHKLDLTNDTDVKAWMDEYGAQMDVCIHSAALSVPRLCEADPAKAQALNLPVAFLEGLAKHAVPIIGLSTDQVYEGTKAPYKETDDLNPLNMYGKTKVELEELLTKLSTQNNNLPMVSLRSSIMLGPKAPILGDKAHRTFLHFCSTRENQETTFWTDECRSVISVDNVVQVLRFFIQKLLSEQQQQKKDDNSKNGSVAGIYNMGGLTRQSRMDMANAVFQHFGYSTDKLIAAEKAAAPPPDVPSPLDITMDSSKLLDLVGDEVKWKSMDEIVKWTFATSE